MRLLDFANNKSTISGQSAQQEVPIRYAQHNLWMKNATKNISIATGNP